MNLDIQKITVGVITALSNNALPAKESNLAFHPASFFEIFSINGVQSHVLSFPLHNGISRYLNGKSAVLLPRMHANYPSIYIE